MNSLVRHAQRIFVALTLAMFLTVLASPAMSSILIGDAGGWVITLRECGTDTCG